MNTEELLPVLSGVRSCGEDRWIARCPAHEDSDPSMTVRRVSDRMLIYCWAGCAVTDICSALEITLADLFHDSKGKPDPVMLRRRRAARSLETWRQSELRRIAKDLRTRDIVILQIDTCVAQGLISPAEAWVSLEYELNGYSDTEDRFHQLVRGEKVLELWRSSKSVAA